MYKVKGVNQLIGLVISFLEEGGTLEKYMYRVKKEVHFVVEDTTE
jgi:hypothetical protein